MSGVSELLKNLPARGAFASPSAGAVVRSVPTPYVAAHETAPPERQVITTDPTNILIRSLLMKKERDARAKKAKEKAKAAAAAASAAATAEAAAAAAAAAASAAKAKAEQQPAASGAKRGGEEPPDGEPAAKREATEDAAGPTGRATRVGGGGVTAATAATAAATATTGTAPPTEAQLSAMTKAALVDRARRAGLAVGGAKASLVTRLAEHYRTRRGS